MIIRFRLFSHLYIHYGGILFCYTPIIRAVAIVAYSFICHFFSYGRWLCYLPFAFIA